MPLDTLHLTIQRMAFTDELPAGSLETAVAVVKQRCRNVAPFQLRIGWLAGSAGAIRFTALPVKPLAGVRNIVLAHATHVRNNAPACVTDDFWPHVSIAYSNAAQPTEPVTAKIEALRSLPPADALITSLALVELRREGKAYRWEALERVGIGG